MNQTSQVVKLFFLLIGFLSGSCVAFQSLSVQKSYCAQSMVVKKCSCDVLFATKLASRSKGFEDEAEAIPNDDDDGWGTSGNDSFDEKTKELRALQNSRQASPPSRTKNAPEGERDLFIPIFAIVSLLGLTGSYGYEMMRLASRGELYLPWNN